MGGMGVSNMEAWRYAPTS